MLQDQVSAFTEPPAQKWNEVATTCLMAVAYWLLLELKVKPTQDHFIYKLGDLNALLKAIALAGHRVVRPDVAQGQVHSPAGAVVVFMTLNMEQAGHACVVKNGLVVGGYNQDGWYSTPGADHQYSEHNLGTDLLWVDRLGPLTQRRVGRTVTKVQYYLYVTPQEAALEVMRKCLG